MKYIDLRLRLPDRLLHPMQAFIRQEDVVEYEEMLAWRVRPDEGVEYALYYVEAQLGPYREAVRGVDQVVEAQIEPIDDNTAHVWVCEATRPETQRWRSAFADRQLIVVPPIRFTADAAMGMTLVGDGSDLQAVLDEVPGDIDVTVKEIGTYDRRGGTVLGTLTPRQLTAIGTAEKMGYYEVPRQASLEEVAAVLNCRESTASVLIRRGERSIISRLFERYGGSWDPPGGPHTQ